MNTCAKDHIPIAFTNSACPMCALLYENGRLQDKLSFCSEACLEQEHQIGELNSMLAKFNEPAHD